MWYLWGGEHICLTTSAPRAKHRHILTGPRVALAIHDPEQPYRCREIKGKVVDIAPDRVKVRTAPTKTTHQ